MDFDVVAEGLYSLPRGEFTAARNAAVARAREQGQRELAGQIGALRRPSTAAWLANLLAREHPEQVQGLRQLGEKMWTAQREGDGHALRKLSQQRHALIQTMVAQVRSMARHPLSEAISGELVSTFTAAANSPAAAQALAGARLTVALDPADAAAEFFAGADTAEPSRPAPVDLDDRELDRLRQEAAEAATAHDHAQRALTDAKQAMAEATATLRELRARLVGAERAEREAQHQIRAAQRDLVAADQRARTAHQRVRDLE